MITKSAIKVDVHVSTPEQAIEAVGQLMLENHLIEESYITGMLDIYHELGPYWVLTKGLAMPHARPEAGAIQSGFALIVLSQAVNFGHEEHDPVSLVFGMAAVDKEQHVNNIRQLTTLLADEQKIQQLKLATTTEQAFEIIYDKG